MDGAAVEALVVKRRRARAHRIEVAVVEAAVAAVALRERARLVVAREWADAGAGHGRAGLPIVLLRRRAILALLNFLAVHLRIAPAQLRGLGRIQHAARVNVAEHCGLKFVILFALAVRDVEPVLVRANHDAINELGLRRALEVAERVIEPQHAKRGLHQLVGAGLEITLVVRAAGERALAGDHDQSIRKLLHARLWQLRDFRNAGQRLRPDEPSAVRPQPGVNLLHGGGVLQRRIGRDHDEVREVRRQP